MRGAASVSVRHAEWIPSAEVLHTWGRGTGENGERAGFKTPEWTNPPRHLQSPNPQEKKTNKKPQINKNKRERERESQDCKAGAWTEGRASNPGTEAGLDHDIISGHL